MRKIVLVTGSRKWTNRSLVEARLKHHLKGKPEILLMHGACKGADMLADEVGRALGYAVIPMPANWDKQGDLAGHIRNTVMLDAVLAMQKCGWTVAVEAFPLSDSKGTVHMMKIAKQAGIEPVLNEEMEA
jgi:hypothetical protein